MGVAGHSQILVPNFYLFIYLSLGNFLLFSASDVA
jgi:hypothetical protein